MGEFWRAKSNDKSNYTEWLFKIIYIQRWKKKNYFLGMKCYFNTKTPVGLDDLEFSQAYWFDEYGQGSEIFHLSEKYKRR